MAIFIIGSLFAYYYFIINLFDIVIINSLSIYSIKRSYDNFIIVIGSLIEIFNKKIVRLLSYNKIIYKSKY